MASDSQPLATNHHLPTTQMIFGLIFVVLGFNSQLNYYQTDLPLQAPSEIDRFMNYSRSFSYSRSVASTYSQSSSRSSQYQTTGIDVDAAALRSPHLLKIITAADTRLTGEIKVDGVGVRKLQGQTTFNLVPYLSKGNNRVEILGEYRPISANVAIEFSGPQTQVSQQVSGNGQLKQMLIITVR